MTMKKVEIVYTADERAEIIAKLKAVCTAQAELWDTLKEIEEAHECSIETDIYLVGELAGGCEFPPSMSDLSDEEVWESFEEHSTAEVYE